MIFRKVSLIKMSLHH